MNPHDPHASSAILRVGDRAPDFELRASMTSTFRSDANLPLVLAFYVFDFGSF